MMRHDGDWEKLCYSYELPWIEANGGVSLKGKSRVVEGTYEIKDRSDGSKGWRLELLGTGHRENIQVHRAHKSMYIQGCILPVHFNDFHEAGLVKGNIAIESHSVGLMGRSKERYYILAREKSKLGMAEIAISAILPPFYPVKKKVSESVVV
jgi:hypothetical protein